MSVHCTSKAKKEGTGRSVAKFMVSVAYGKGVIDVHQYQGNINGEKYAQIVCDKFPDFFGKSANLKGRYFMQDNGPSQNSHIANEAFEQVKAILFKIPPRSLDLNPIENIFNLASKKIRLDPKNRGSRRKTWHNFLTDAKRFY